MKTFTYIIDADLLADYARTPGAAEVHKNIQGNENRLSNRTLVNIV